MSQQVNYIFCDPASERFLWQEELYIYNLLKIKVDPRRVFLLTTKDNSDNIKILKKEFPNINIFAYSDIREKAGKIYPATIKPWLMHQFCTQHPEYLNQIFYYTDSDIMLKHEPVVPTGLDKYHWYGSDCNSYLNYDYIHSKDYQRSDLTQEMCDILNINKDWVKSINNRSIGAQYLMVGMNRMYWKDVYYYSIWLKQYLDKIENRYKHSYKKKTEPIQKWTAEMWATLWVMHKYQIEPEIDPNGEFAWGTCNAHGWIERPEVNIYHNAGVTREEHNKNHLFYKGDYFNKTPFEDLDNILKDINHDSASYYYVKLIEEVKQALNK